ncbi:Mitochondrial folate transporter-like [Carpediemonas membranifera]|uniref:Mitochondrial folate transporter-like n=1 Tax=Carpediemonas membranifera TaxID=201153 RepID=A0A8J6E459_9EUKA|nr:Mitochondrial folate transporter-like [Carpediemonas membranifera]|eukprot:KAG9396476.1 Mitochondrial folate transporter-like [Carpediemonas membranifera]
MTSESDAAIQPKAMVDRRILQFLSGIASGSFISSLFLPFDVIASRSQVSGSSERRSALASAIYIAQHEGLFKFFDGIGPTLAGSALSTALYHPVRTTVTAWTKRSESSVREALGLRAADFSTFSPTRVVACSFLSGVLTNTLMNPVYVVKSRLDVQHKHETGSYSGVIDCVRTMLREEGLRSFYQGLTLYQLQALAPSIRFGVYDLIKHRHEERTGAQISKKADLVLNTATAFTAISVTYPLFVLRVRQRVDRTNKPFLTHMMEAMDGRGLMGLYSGYGVSIAKALPFSVLNLMAYNMVDGFLVRGAAKLEKRVNKAGKHSARPGL